MSQSAEFEHQDVPQTTDSSVQSLAHLWAKKYVEDLQVDADDPSSNSDLSLEQMVSVEGRIKTSQTLKQALRFTSAQAWAKTESLLAKEVQRHNIDPTLIDPWQIANDTIHLFDKTLEIYTQQTPTRKLSGWASPSAQLQNPNSLSPENLTDMPSPGQLSVAVASDIGKIRKKYTAQDSRVLGFVSMQFHYSGQMLLDLLSPIEQHLVGSYLKVIDDHLYMPLQRSYEAAANYAYDSPVLAAVQTLLSMSSSIAQTICQRMFEIYPTYQSHSGLLKFPQVQISSIRDIEMFQVYLCLCALEGEFSALQEELFPLCVMLYPPLQVRWNLVRHMLRLLGQEIVLRLGDAHTTVFRSASRTLWEMFSPDILADHN
ncbi:MAG: hypothetical protein KME16_19495 [Scytolyngbya sp. HA4215-MV1]|jgi:hypothetical protein|nr:hypothetical protein [Scytolyngbya sp. HA4215-MV1]